MSVRFCAFTITPLPHKLVREAGFEPTLNRERIRVRAPVFRPKLKEAMSVGLTIIPPHIWQGAEA